MSITFSKLFHLLVDIKMKEGDFRRHAGISAPTLAKLRTDANITTEVINKICSALNVQPADIMEFVPESKKEVSK